MQTKNVTRSEKLHKLALTIFSAILVICVAIGLMISVFFLPVRDAELIEIVSAQLPASGVSHPVTAVLLNFRGYDTLLEMAVLLLALIGTWSLAPLDAQADDTRHPPGEMLDSLTRLLTPIIVLVAGYLLWAGAHAPGGAFQAGALLASLGVMIQLTGWKLPIELTGIYLRFIHVCGLVVFLLVAASGWFNSAPFFSLPPDLAGILILLIETFAMLSIGLTLATLFLLGRPHSTP